MEALLLSSSRVGDSAYLAFYRDWIYSFFPENGRILFVPFAGVSINWDQYTANVQAALPELRCTGIHTLDHAHKQVSEFDGILVGGGNTFNLLHQLYQQNLVNAIKSAVASGVKYCGWSAGANIAGLSIRTTNDMPIIEPQSFTALGLLPMQLNPHYTDYKPPGHNGETRDERLGEFMQLHPETDIIAISEGAGLKVSKSAITVLGNNPSYLFNAGEKKRLTENQKIALN